MPRHNRREAAGGLHHITAKSPSRRLLFIDDSDRQRYLGLLAREIRERQWRMLTFCLLSNHLHLLIETPEPDLGAGMKAVHQKFSRLTNQARGEGGHLFGARFYSGVVESERHALGCLRYIARNPVKASICSTPQEWSWSAHRALAGMAAAPSFLDVAATYEHLGDTPSQARDAYVRLVAQSDADVLADLSRRSADDWIAEARDDFAISVGDIAGFLAVSEDTVYRRLRQTGATGVSVT